MMRLRRWLPIIAVAMAAAALAGSVLLWIDAHQARTVLRMNQCDGLRADVTERTIIIKGSDQETPLTAYWRDQLLPDLRERHERTNCAGVLPRLPPPNGPQ